MGVQCGYTMARFIRNSVSISLIAMATTENVSIDPFLILSHFATAHAVYAADTLGLWEALGVGDSQVHIESFVRERNLSMRPFSAIVDYLVRVGFLDFTDASHQVICLTAIGRRFLAEDC